MLRCVSNVWEQDVLIVGLRSSFLANRDSLEIAKWGFCAEFVYEREIQANINTRRPALNLASTASGVKNDSHFISKNFQPPIVCSSILEVVL